MFNPVTYIDNPTTQMITMQAIREKYPNPEPAVEGATGYCVGGALVLFMGLEDPENDTWFPGVKAIAEALQKANPALDYRSAERLAWDIIADNDHGYMDLAWDKLDIGLTLATWELDLNAAK
jgi:dienelactone hydrolase